MSEQHESAEVVPPHLAWLPPWIASLDAHVWVTSPDGRIVYANSGAHDFIARTLQASENDACHDAIGGRDVRGQAFCRPDCELHERALRGERLGPVRIEVGRDEDRRWLCLTSIPLTGPDGSRPWLVHVAHDVSAAHRSEQYMTRVAHASESAPLESRPLTPREVEVLELLAQGEDPHGVSRRLHVSYTTVRNHIQHVLAKLGVHSAQEAIAVYLLRDSTSASPCPDCRGPSKACGRRRLA